MSAPSETSSKDGSGRASSIQGVMTWGALGVLVGALSLIPSLDLEVWRTWWSQELYHRLGEAAGILAWPRLTAGAAGGILLAAVLRGRRSLPPALARPILALASLALVGCSYATLVARSRPVAEGPNVLLIVLDTTRSDRLSPYGYERETTPRLARLAEEGITYTNAYSVSSWTCPSHASLFTGLYPIAHGVTQEAWNLPHQQLTLAEILWEAGYRTLGSVGNPMVGKRLGFQQGFDRYHEDWFEPEAIAAPQHPAVRHLVELLDEPSPRAFFAFINLIEVHSPYSSGPYRKGFDRHPEVELAHNDWRAYFTSGDPDHFTAEQLAHLSDLYDAELRHADDIVDACLAALEQRGILDDTFVVVTSDHGEHFGAHALVDHVFNLYEGNVSVPLLMRYPARIAKNVRDAAPVQLQDLFPTILHAAGVEQRGLQGHGVDLLGEAAIDEERPRLLSYSYPSQAFGACGDAKDSKHLDVYRRRLYGLRRGSMKLIVEVRPQGLGEASMKLFDLEQDPEELFDLAGTPEGLRLAREMRLDLDRLRASLGNETPLEQYLLTQPSVLSGRDDPDTTAALSKLGYVDGESDSEAEGN